VVPSGFFRYGQTILVSSDWDNWTTLDIAPYVNHVIEIVGPDRLIFGSDWPVMTLAGTFGEWVTASSEILSNLSRDEIDRIFYQNADAFYRF